MRNILSWLMLTPVYMFSLFPLRVHYFFSDIISWLLREILKYRASTIHINLARSFPKLKYEEINSIAKEYYKYMSDIICETIWGLTRTIKHIEKKGLFKVENPEILNKAVNLHKGVIIMLGHTGNWEMIYGITSYSKGEANFKQEQCIFAYHKMSSKIAESIFKRLRLTHVTNAESVMPSNKIIRFVIKHKWEDRLYIFNSDQSPESSAKFAGNFLNQPTFWVTGGEAIAKKMEMPVVYLYIDRKSRSKYVIRYTSICEDGSKEKDDFILKEYARLLEKDINTNKVNWLWSHKRWKHKFE